MPKYSAKIVLNRGRRHILSQKEILEAIPGMPKPAVPEFNVRRELWGYEFADVVSVTVHGLACESWTQ